MASVGAQFRHLHSLHLRLKEIQDQLAKGPRLIKMRQNRMMEAEQQLGLKEVELKDSRVTVDRKNLDLRTKEAHLVELQGKLNTSSSNREYDIIRGQIEADKAAKAVLEDEILEWLDRLEGLQQEIAQSKQQIEEQQQENRLFASDFESKAVELREREAALKISIGEAETIVPKEILPQYRRVVEAYGSEALACADKGVCNQCFVALTPQNRVALNNGKLLFCHICGRLMYPPDQDS